ncbi:hypothetical protein MKX01_012021 [Papaver californicum]|nr:hypothetical protein MKX01_012021 [Papaver californicum]
MGIGFLLWVLICWIITSLLLNLLSAIIERRNNRKKVLNGNLDCIICTGGHNASPESLLTRAIDRFGVKLLQPPQVVHLYKRKWIEEGTYPPFTTVGAKLWFSLSVLGSFVQTYSPTFGYPVTKSSSINILAGCNGFVGACAHLAVVNSSWTQAHIVKHWGIPRRTKRIYPPCDTKRLQELPLEKPINTPAIISVAQFRPEKAHTLQLEAFSVAIEKLDPNSPRPKLQFVGSCRNQEDEQRLQNLKEKAIELNVEKDMWKGLRCLMLPEDVQGDFQRKIFYEDFKAAISPILSHPSL